MIFTLGTSQRSLDEFLKILKFYQIKIVVDVRRFPKSKFFWFEKENLKKELQKVGIEYYHLENLGGFRKGGYENYMKIEDFKKGIQKVLELSKKGNLVLICKEKFPWRCHRRFIKNYLKKMGIEVLDII